MVAGFGLFHRERSVTGPHPRRYATPPPPSNEWERGPGVRASHQLAIYCLTDSAMLISPFMMSG
jgi:hypothetical protein